MPTVKTLLPQKQADMQLIRVAAYCRVSSDSTEQKESFAAQVEYYTGLIGAIPSGHSRTSTLKCKPKN